MMRADKGIFITFEGPEGSGKSTQSTLLADALKKKGHDVIHTREPGGTAIGQQIRSILLNPENTAMARMTEVLLFVADRSQHLAEKIQPALDAGKIVICDRYVDSTTAYQIGGRNLDPTLIESLNTISMSTCVPDRTYLIDIPVEEGLKRATRQGADRFEKEFVAFHDRVRATYLSIAKKEPARVLIFSGLDTIENIQQNILTETETLLKTHVH